MTVGLPLVTVPHVALNRPARPVGDSINDPRWKTLAASMTQTMDDHQGVGLAANQIAVMRRVAIIKPYKRATTLIDPRIIDAGGEQLSREGCLSLPGGSWIVQRAQHVTIEYVDLDGETRTLTAHGYAATVIQHEIDHLDGIMIDQRSGQYVRGGA